MQDRGSYRGTDVANLIVSERLFSCVNLRRIFTPRLRLHELDFRILLAEAGVEGADCVIPPAARSRLNENRRLGKENAFGVFGANAPLAKQTREFVK